MPLNPQLALCIIRELPTSLLNWIRDEAMPGTSVQYDATTGCCLFLPPEEDADAHWPDRLAEVINEVKRRMQVIAQVPLTFAMIVDTRMI